MNKGLKSFAFFSIWLLFIISCRKNESPPPPVDCISEIDVTPAAMANQVTPAQLNVIDSLFQANSLSTANEQFIWIDSNQYMPPGYNNFVDQIEVISYRWYNNLPVFAWNDNIIFYNGILQPVSLIYHGAIPGPDTTFRRSLESLQQIYRDNFMKVVISGGAANSNIRHPDPGFRDSCLFAQPGYFGANYFDSTLTYYSSVVKAWKVAPAGGFPMVFIADSTGAAWPAPVFYP